MIADTPTPPYYAVIFTSKRSDVGDDYSEMADRMVELAGQEEGFLGVESVREEYGITVSYWKDNVEHKVARKRRREEWYLHFKVRVAKIERDYQFNKY